MIFHVFRSMCYPKMRAIAYRDIHAPTVVFLLLSYVCAVWMYFFIACAFGMELGGFECLRTLMQMGIASPFIGLLLLYPRFYKWSIVTLCFYLPICAHHCFFAIVVLAAVFSIPLPF